MAQPSSASAGNLTTGHPHDKPHHGHWPLTAVLFAFVFALAFFAGHVPGTWLHLKTGARILATGSIPRAEPYSYTVAGRPWTTDSWLADVLFCAIDRVVGPGGLVALKALAAALGFALLLPVNPASPLVAATILAFGAIAAASAFTETPAVFSFLLFALMIRALRPRRLFHWTMVVNVAAVELLWANLHGTTAVLGVWLIALKVMETSLRTAERERLNYFGLLVVAALALLCNPHGPAVVAHMFAGLEPSSSVWQPLPRWLNLYAVFVVAGAASCAVCLQQEFFLTVAAASLIALGFVVPELRPLSILGCCPVISLARGHFLDLVDDRPSHVARWAGAMAVVLLAYGVFVEWPAQTSRGYGRPGLEGALAFLSANGVTGRLFNEPDAGAAIIGQSDRQVFVDERPAVYGAAFMTDAERWATSFRELARIYRFDYALVLNRRSRSCARAIDVEPDWALVYADDAALVYVRKNGLDGRLAKGAPGLPRPNELWPQALDPLLADPASRVQALRRLDAWLVAAPGAIQPLLWKAHALDATGSLARAGELIHAAEARPHLWKDPELLGALGSLYEERGELDVASQRYWRAVFWAQRRGDGAAASQVLRRLAGLARRRGDEAGARILERRSQDALSSVAG